MLSICCGDTNDNTINHLNEQITIHILKTARDKTSSNNRLKGISMLTSSSQYLTDIKSRGNLSVKPSVKH
jgi:hypothetical protein